MQPRTVLKWILILVLFPPMNSHAAVKDIHSEKLPQLSALPKVLADITELEPYLKNWSGKWPYPVPKATVVARMKADLKVLERALKDHPDNVELLLLTALAAHYAYNVDVNSANDLVRTSVERAHALAPDDLRIMWFRDIHLCQANFVILLWLISFVLRALRRQASFRPHSGKTTRSVPTSPTCRRMSCARLPESQKGNVQT